MSAGPPYVAVFPATRKELFEHDLIILGDVPARFLGPEKIRWIRDFVREGVYQNFSNALEKMGVQYIEAVGRPFDVHLHEAMMQMPAPEGTPPGTVLGEIQRGYRLGDRVLR